MDLGPRHSVDQDLFDHRLSSSSSSNSAIHQFTNPDSTIATDSLHRTIGPYFHNLVSGWQVADKARRLNLLMLGTGRIQKYAGFLFTRDKRTHSGSQHIQTVDPGICKCCHGDIYTASQHIEQPDTTEAIPVTLVIFALEHRHGNINCTFWPSVRDDHTLQRSFQVHRNVPLRGVPFGEKEAVLGKGFGP
ncbi:hypothetical protein KCU88_g4178, partial [Aureobasidium melanogenum]